MTKKLNRYIVVDNEEPNKVFFRGFSEGYKQGMETNNFKAPMPIPVPGGWSEPGTAPNPYIYPNPNPITCPQVWYSSTMTTTDTAKGFERK